jgi:hypothetical protein
MGDSDYKRFRGRPLATDPQAESAQPSVPAFIARPAGAPVNYGFPVLDDVEVDGFKFGMITDFLSEADNVGDAFVVAPDGSRAGLVWEISRESYFEEVCPLGEERWGVWAVSFPYMMKSNEDARRNLEAVLPNLKKQWELWKVLYG